MSAIALDFGSSLRLRACASRASGPEAGSGWARSPLFPEAVAGFEEEEHGQTDVEYMSVPCSPGTTLVMIHAHLALALLEALFDGPAQEADPGHFL